MKNFYIIISIISIFILTIVSGCYSDSRQDMEAKNSSQVSEMVNDDMKKIYDDDLKIIEKCGATYYSEYVFGVHGNRAKGKIGGYYGAFELWNLNAKEDGKITINNNCKFNGGKFKVVLVTPNKKLKKLFEYTESGEAQKETITIDVNRGENKIIKVGYDADIDIDISLDADEM